MTSRRRAIATVGVLIVGLALPSLAQARPTYVSLTFDDATASQASAASSLAAHGMRGTFYVNSGDVGSDPYFMDWPQIQGIASAGHEIGGHTTTHPDLTTLTPAEQTAEICGDRQALQAHGFDPVSFAYPFAKHDATSRATTQSCGYTSARGVGNVGCLPGCAPAESVPPPDPTLLRTAAGVEDTTSLATLQGYVINAVENGGGWVILVFHTFCNDCGDPNSMTPANFDALLDFIQGQAGNGVSVKTVREVMAIPAAPPPPNVLRNASLENGLTSLGPDCWTRSFYEGESGGGSVGSWSHTVDAHSGANAERIEITSFSDGDHKLSSTQDPAGTSACSPAATPGHIYQAGAWYKTSAGADVRMVAHYRDAAGVWQFWREQPLAASTTWTHALWQTPKVPAGADALSIGFSLRSVGSATVDDFSLGDIDADYQAPVSSATSPASSNSPTITVSYAAADEAGGSGVATVELWAKAPAASVYTKAKTDSAPGASGSFSYTASGGDGSYRFYTVATDRAGNREATSTPQATTLLDTIAPVSAAMSPAYRTTTSITVTYTASDAGSGLATVELYAKAPGASVFTKVGTDTTPTASESMSYTAAAGNGSYGFYTVATDRAGKRETRSAAQATTVVDTVVPTAQNIRSDNGSGSDGKADTGDTVTFTYSEAMSPASMLAAWSGGSTQVLVKLVDASNSADTLQVWSADNAARLAVANPLALNGDYVPSSGAVFRATMALNASGSVVTVTLGSLQSGSVRPASQANFQKNGPLKWTPDSRATDRAGNRVSTTAVSKPGTAF